MATFIASGAVSLLLMDSTIWIDYFNGVASSQTDDLDRILCYRTENPFVSCRVAHRFAGKRKLTGTRLPSRWA
jgi:hypothetical protein